MEIKLSVIQKPWDVFHPEVTWHTDLETAQERQRRAVNDGAHEVTLLVKKREDALKA